MSLISRDGLAFALNIGMKSEEKVFEMLQLLRQLRLGAIEPGVVSRYLLSEGRTGNA